MISEGILVKIQSKGLFLFHIDKFLVNLATNMKLFSISGSANHVILCSLEGKLLFRPWWLD